jgi:AraC family transcriptional regulator
MNPAERALWFIESHFARDISLDDVAAIGGVTRYHMTRAFAAATGLPVMAYAKVRRLSEAAKVLAKGAPDILAVAVDAGYGSHEAFTSRLPRSFGVNTAAGEINSCHWAKVEGKPIGKTVAIRLARMPAAETGILPCAGAIQLVNCGS